MTDNRSNQTMRTIVNLGQRLAHSSIRNAAEYMRDHRVPLAVAERVLIKQRSNKAAA